MDELPDTPAKVPSPLTPAPLLLRPRTPARLEPIPSPTTPESSLDVPQTPGEPSPLTPVPVVPYLLIPRTPGEPSPLTPVPAYEIPRTPMLSSLSLFVAPSTPYMFPRPLTPMPLNPRPSPKIAGMAAAPSFTPRSAEPVPK